MSDNTQGKEAKRHRVRDGFKTGFGRLKQAIKPSSHQPESSTPSIVDIRASSPAPTNKNSTPVTQGEQPGAKNKAWVGLETTLRALETSTKLFSPLRSTIGELAACLDVVETAAKNRDDYEELASELGITIDILNQYASEFDSEEGKSSVARIVQSVQVQVAHISKQREHSNTKRILESADDREDVVKSYRRIEVLFRQLQNEVTLRTWRNTSKQRMASLLRGMSPIEDARYDSKYSMVIKRRGCTPETREKVQEELQDWVQDPTAPKIYWMNGMAGTGKTTIAYSLCSWLEENTLLGASFFCSRISSSCRDLSEIVPTIAYQLAHYSSAYRSALCTVLEDDPDAVSRNVTRQFDKLLKGPLAKIEDAIPEGVVIVIDALDECQDQHGVRLMLEVLLCHAIDLPLKFFVTSRPEPSIRDKMLSPGSHSPSILHLHDIEQSIVGEDIKKYLTEALGSMSPAPSSSQVERLTKQAGKLFIYAATAARYILPDGAYVDSSARLRAMLELQTESNGSDKHKKKYKELDILYATILSAALNDEILEEDELEVMRVVLSTIICAKEPLSAPAIASLLGLTEQQVFSTLQPLRSVLHVPEGGGQISALHASFPDYILNQSRAGQFYCDRRVQNGLMADRCFNVMDGELRFNICQLESSYTFDHDIPDLEVRVDKFISVALGYACRYWGLHLQLGNCTSALQDKLLAFLARRLLFWMEVMNLKGYIGASQGVILCAQNWISAANAPVARGLHRQLSDARNFVTQFAASPCSQSTPHIYHSALPSCPKSSSVHKNYWGRTQGLVEIDGTVFRSREMAPLATWVTVMELNACALSADGDRIVCGSADSTIWILSAHTGGVMFGPFEGHTAAVESVTFSSDSSLIVSGSADSTIRVWDALTGKLINDPIKGHTGSIISVAFSQDAARVISGSSDRTIGVWSTQTGSAIVGPFGAQIDGLTAIAVSPNGNLIASASSDYSVRLWDITYGSLSNRTLEGHTGSVYSVAFSYDGSRLASGSSDHTVRIWDPRTGTLLALTPNRHYGSIRSVAFSQDGTRVASGCDAGTIRIWDIDTVTATAGPFNLKSHAGTVKSIGFSPDGSRFISSYHDNTICVWDAYLGGSVDLQEEHCELAMLLAFSPDGNRLITASDEGSLCVRDANNGQVIVGPLQAHAESPTSLALSTNDNYAAAGFFDGVVYVFNAMTSEIIIAPFAAHEDSINSVAFAPDGQCFITASSDFTAKIWDVHTGDIKYESLQGHTEAILSIQFSPDGAFIATGSSDGTVRIWETGAGNCKHALLGHESGVNSVAFSPDRAHVVSGSDDMTIKLWKIRDGDCTFETFKEHKSEVESVCFNHDGTQIISSAFKGSVLVQDVQTRDILARPLEGHTKSVKSIAICPSGPRIATSTVDFFTEDYSIIRISNIVIGRETDDALKGRWKFEKNGFILVDGKILIWVPPDLHECIPRPHETLALGSQGSLRIGWQNLALGEKWTECYRSEE